MKYLKLFEEMELRRVGRPARFRAKGLSKSDTKTISNPISYKKISKIEFDRFKESHTRVDFFNENRKEIEKCISNGIWNYSHKLIGTKPFEIFDSLPNRGSSIKLKPIVRKPTNPTAEITYWSDEYYLIRYSFSITSSYTNYYLCDQIDGIIEFIEDLNSGKI